ncbi:MAG: SGNH/GDSL hydrolase family protein [Elusimicrobiota bacterium]
MTTRSRDFFLRPLLLLLGLALPLTAMEFGLRISGYSGDAERKKFLYDDDFGDSPKDSWLRRLIGESGLPTPPDPIVINDETVPILKPKPEIRILFLGDSATVGSGVGLANSYPSLVRRELARRMPEKSVRVINSGIGGLNTINELQVFELLLRRLKPDIVIVGLFMANDINFNLKNEIYRRNRISCFNPTAEMRSAGVRRMILPKDDHPTVLGHRLLGQAVMNGIEPWLAAPRRHRGAPF